MNKTSSSKIIYIYSPLFVVLYNLAGNLSNDIYLPTLPIIGGEFHTSNFFVQFSMTIWFIGVAVPQIYFGLIAERFGSRPLMLWGGVIFLLGTMCCLKAPNIQVLLLGRFLQGVGVSSLNIATYATVRSHHYHETNTMRFLSWVNMAGSIAPLIGPILGSYLYRQFGWRSTFSFVLVFGFFALGGLYFFLVESYEFGEKRHMRINWQSSWLYYKQIISNKRLWRLTFTYTCFLGAVVAYLTTAPLVICNYFNIPVEYFGLTQILPSALYLAGGLTVNQFVDKYKPEQLIHIGFVILLVSGLWFIAITIFEDLLSIYSYLLAISCFLFGFAFVGSPLMSRALGSSPHKGVSAAVLGVSMASMASLGSLAAAIFYEGKFAAITLILCTFILLGVLNYWAMRYKETGRKEV
jgi:DHA1 family bicyclomycin/chloramphenicol resistance-like MFS transporter